jgi:hypothetical protein
MPDIPFQFGRLPAPAVMPLFNAATFTALSRTANSFVARHSLAAPRAGQIARMAFLHSPASRAQQRVFQQLSMFRSPAWDAQRRIMQQTSMLRSPGWLAMQRAIEQTKPLMSSAAYKRIALDTQFLATKASGMPEWLRMFPRLPAVEIPPHRAAKAYEPSDKYPKVVPLRRRLAKIRVIRRHDTQADDGPQFPPDPHFGFRQGRW